MAWIGCAYLAKRKIILFFAKKWTPTLNNAHIVDIVGHNHVKTLICDENANGCETDYGRDRQGPVLARVVVDPELVKQSVRHESPDQIKGIQNECPYPGHKTIDLDGFHCLKILNSEKGFREGIFKV